ncbi:MAG: TniB family NTP-binding protein [Gammaproteobacteria bacterium]|nr:TniB family NTP-binding protein [Gammaproteobacteria bacterium]
MTDHLSTAAREMLSCPDKERIKYILKPIWFNYERAASILKDMQMLLEYPRIDRMPNMLLAGETNNGKTMLTRHFLTKHPGYEIDEGYHQGVCFPVFYVQMPHSPSEGEFYDIILHRLDTGYIPKNRNAVKKQRVLELLKQFQVRMLLLDEIQHVLAGNLNKQRLFLNLLKYLSNELRLPIVAIGTQEALQAVSADPQLANRFDPRFLIRWQMSEDYLRLLSSFERTLPLPKASGLIQMAIAERILNMSEGKIGEMYAIIARAFRAAVDSGDEKITEKTLKNIQWTKPSDRGRIIR